MILPHAPHTVFLVESATDDEALTRRALSRTGIPMRIEVERAGDAAILRYLGQFADAPPSLVIVSDGLLRVRADEVVAAVRKVHARGTAAILHLLSSEGHVAAEGADHAVIKPVAYEEYLSVVGEAARHLLLRRHASG